MIRHPGTVSIFREEITPPISQVLPDVVYPLNFRRQGDYYLEEAVGVSASVPVKVGAVIRRLHRTRPEKDFWDSPYVIEFPC